MFVLSLMFKQQSIKSYIRERIVTAPTHSLSGAKSRTPCDWKSFMGDNKNKTQLIRLLLDQWTADKYATRLVDRNLSHFIDQGVFVLPVKTRDCFKIPRRKQIKVL